MVAVAAQLDFLRSLLANAPLPGGPRAGDNAAASAAADCSATAVSALPSLGPPAAAHNAVAAHAAAGSAAAWGAAPPPLVASTAVVAAAEPAEQLCTFATHPAAYLEQVGAEAQAAERRLSAYAERRERWTPKETRSESASDIRRDTGPRTVCSCVWLRRQLFYTCKCVGNRDDIGCCEVSVWMPFARGWTSPRRPVVVFLCGSVVPSSGPFFLCASLRVRFCLRAVCAGLCEDVSQGPRARRA